MMTAGIARISVISTAVQITGLVDNPGGEPKEVTFTPIKGGGWRGDDGTLLPGGSNEARALNDQVRRVISEETTE